MSNRTDLQFDPADDQGALNRALWHPGFMTNFADAEAMALLGTLPALGTTRVPCAGFSGTDAADARTRTRAQVPQLLALQAQGAQLVVCIGLMPRFLSRIPSQVSPSRGGNPAWACMGPRNLGEWQTFVAQQVSIYRDAGIHPLYAFWNENFWIDPLGQLWDLYADTMPTIVRTDPQAKVGGCDWGSPADTTIPSFLAAAQARGARLDALTVHAFVSGLADGMAELRGFPDLLEQHGFPRVTPIVVPEFNRWTNFPGPIEADPGRTPTAESYGPYLCAVLQEFERAGVRGACLATLQDFDPKAAGGQGVLTRGPCARKAAWAAVEALAKLRPQRIGYTLEGLAAGIGCVATAGAAVVWRYDPTGPTQVQVRVQGHGRREIWWFPRYAVRLVEWH